LWKLETSDGLWQEILRKKYVKDNFAANCKVRPGQSHFWQGLMHVKEDFFMFCKKKIGNGRRTRFWEDFWVGDKTLVETFPRLYNLTMSQKLRIVVWLK
jgi:hypothetical protein